MPKKIITFLGTDTLYTTTYTYQDCRVCTEYLAAALVSFYPGYDVYAFVTPEAKSRWGSGLPRAVADHGGGLKLIDVPAVEAPEQLWQVFARIDEQIGDGDTIVFDITHSYRSLPLLAMLVLSYLRVVRDFHLEALVYAPYKEYNDSPVYDLRPFVSLLEWTNATHLFMKTGDADDLTTQLEQSEGRPLGFEPDLLRRAAAALRLHRPDEARRLSWKLVDRLRSVDPTALNADLRPFGTLAKRLQMSFEAITPEPPSQDDLEQQLQQELALIRWNAELEQWAAAVTVAREWLVSLVCWHAGWTAVVSGVGRWRTKGCQDGARAVLNRLKEQVRAVADQLQGDMPLRVFDECALEEESICALRDCLLFPKLPCAQGAADALLRYSPRYTWRLGKTWSAVATLRNDLNHAGALPGREPLSVTDLIAQAGAVPNLLEALYGHSGLVWPESQLWPNA